MITYSCKVWPDAKELEQQKAEAAPDEPVSSTTSWNDPHDDAAVMVDTDQVKIGGDGGEHIEAVVTMNVQDSVSASYSASTNDFSKEAFAVAVAPSVCVISNTPTGSYLTPHG